MLDEKIAFLEAKLDKVLALLDQNLNPQESYTTKQAAAYLEYSQDTVKKYCQKGVIKAEMRKLRGRAKRVWLITKDELDKFKNNTL